MEQFRDAAQTLGAAEDRDGARAAMRRLILLGHVDQSPDGMRWSASPAALVRFAAGAGGYIAGRRTPKFLSELAEKCGALNESPQDCYAGTPRIADAGIASERLADVLPGVDGRKDGLKAVDGVVPASYDVIGRWEGGEFRRCDTLSLRDGRYRGESGMYRFSRDMETPKAASGRLAERGDSPRALAFSARIHIIMSGVGRQPSKFRRMAICSKRIG